MKNFLFASCLIAVLSACVTLSGNYSIEAFDANGNLVSGKYAMTAQGGGIYNARNALCMAFPKSKIVIINLKTKQELSSESPYQCK